MLLLSEIQHNPPISYFMHAIKAESLLFEQFENYIKQSYRNRCHILTANGIQTLIVPVKRGKSKIIVKDIEIDYGQKWLNNHWRSITSAYGKSPYFEYYSDYLHAVYYKKHKYLFDFNVELTKLYLKLLKINIPIKLTEVYQSEYQGNVLDIRNLIDPKVDDYSRKLFFKPYNQVFGKQFAKDLSIIDLLFNEGPNSKEVLESAGLQF